MSAPRSKSGKARVRKAGQPFTDRKREKAARLMAEDMLTLRVIAQKVDVAERTLYDWKRDEDFLRRIDEISKVYANRLIQYGIGSKEYRLKVLGQLHDKLLTVVAERAEAHEEAGPGAGTGVVAVTEKGLGSGENFSTITELTVDTGLLKEIRELQTQAAEELGQHISKHDVTSAGEPLPANAVPPIIQVNFVDPNKKKDGGSTTGN